MRLRMGTQHLDFSMIHAPTDTAIPAGSNLSKEFLNAMFVRRVSENEIVQITRAFPLGKAVGYDDILMSVIKQSIDLISKPLTHIITYLC